MISNEVTVGAFNFLLGMDYESKKQNFAQSGTHFENIYVYFT